jgi:hypothetical protein
MAAPQDLEPLVATIENAIREFNRDHTDNAIEQHNRLAAQLAHDNPVEFISRISWNTIKLAKRHLRDPAYNVRVNCLRFHPSTSHEALLYMYDTNQQTS